MWTGAHIQNLTVKQTVTDFFILIVLEAWILGAFEAITLVDISRSAQTHKKGWTKQNNRKHLNAKRIWHNSTSWKQTTRSYSTIEPLQTCDSLLNNIINKQTNRVCLKQRVNILRINHITGKTQLLALNCGDEYFFCLSRSIYLNFKVPVLWVIFFYFIPYLAQTVKERLPSSKFNCPAGTVKVIHQFWEIEKWRHLSPNCSSL